MKFTVYISSTPGRTQIRDQQLFIHRVLLAKKVEFEEIDISDPRHEKQKDFMIKTLKEQGLAAMPPQIFCGEKYIADYEKLYLSNETESVEELLEIPGAAELKKKRMEALINDEVNEEKADEEKKADVEEDRKSEDDDEDNKTKSKADDEGNEKEENHSDVKDERESASRDEEEETKSQVKGQNEEESKTNENEEKKADVAEDRPSESAKIEDNESKEVKPDEDDE